MARYLPEVPLKHFHQRYASTARLTWVFSQSLSFPKKRITCLISLIFSSQFQLFDLRVSSCIFADIFPPGYNEHFHGPVVLSTARVGATEAHRAHNSNFIHTWRSSGPTHRNLRGNTGCQKMYTPNGILAYLGISWHLINVTSKTSKVRRYPSGHEDTDMSHIAATKSHRRLSTTRCTAT
jgi:hypothetical protein